jgi:ACDE family multidrug resistance protein
MILPCLNSMIIGAVKKSERGMITSLYNGVRFIGVAVGPPVFTWLLGFSTNVMFYSIASLTLLFAVIAFFLITPQKHKQQQKSAAGQADAAKSADDNEVLQQMKEAAAEAKEEPAELDEEAKKQQEMHEILGFDPARPISSFLKRGRTKSKT